VKFGILEIVGIFVTLVGCGTVVASASMVSTALAVLTAGTFLILFGIIAVYVAVTLEAAAKAAAPKPGERT
jgi:hypothetical protein